ncbi:hypothetical protein N7470_006256 [Penicillium chermesinum]|nr:hypothetical protein N7470_006256 [Penicillium chermesinum]
MLTRSILLGGMAAMSAHALLVIPEMNPEFVEAPPIDDAPMSIQPVPSEDVTFGVVLPCTDCPFREVDAEGVVSWTDGKPSSLLLEFSLEDNHLLANNHQIFPPSEPVLVGYALEITPLQAPSDAPGTDLLDVRFTILDLEAHPVPVDTVTITLIQTPSGGVLIADTNIEETAPPPEKLSWKKCNGKAKCLQDLVFHRIQGLLRSAKDRIIGMGKAGRKGCHGKNQGVKGMGGHHKHDDDEGPMGHHPHHGEHGEKLHPDYDEGRHHHPHHMHHPHGALARTFSRIVRFIIVPGLIGGLAGFAASVIGMLVGKAIVFVWQRYRGRKSQEHKAAWEDGNTSEKQGLMTDSSEEDLPAYVEGAEVRHSEDH